MDRAYKVQTQRIAPFKMEGKIHFGSNDKNYFSGINLSKFEVFADTSTEMF